MARLRLHGPRRPGSSNSESSLRRPSEAISGASSSTGGAATTPDDTIVVANPRKTSSKTAEASPQLESESAAKTASAVKAVPHQEAEKEDTEMTEADDEVEEYDFTNEPEDGISSDDGLDIAHYRDPKGTMVISDDEGDDDKTMWQIDNRPWRNPDFSVEARKKLEEMYSTLDNTPLQGDLEYTELYQDEKDKEMLRYLDDFPLDKWVVSERRAQRAMEKLNERRRWRTLGIPIFRHDLGIPATPWQTANGPVMPHSYQAQYPHPSYPPQHVGYHQPHPYMMAPNGQLQAPFGQMPPPPQHVLASQHHPQGPYPMYGQHGPYAMPPGPLPQYMAAPSYPSNPKRSRGKAKASVSQDFQGGSSGPFGMRTPPYALQAKPQGAKVPTDQVALPARFPWNREGLDFLALRGRKPVWDDGIYSNRTLVALEQVRQNNRAIIAAHNHTKEPGNKRPRSQSNESSNELTRLDYYSFASDADAQKALNLDPSFLSPETVAKACMIGSIPLQQCRNIMICFNTPRTSQDLGLTQARFSIKDHVLTIKQLMNMPILDRRSALCIIDFCPNLLRWEMLLRICAESGLPNKEIYNRICENGNLVSPSTVTKRIGAALGQKQWPKPVDSNGRAPEDSYYNENVKDFNDYTEFFGNRTSHRGSHERTVEKRRGEDDDAGVGPSKKRTKVAQEGEVTTPGSILSTDGTIEVEESEEEEGGEDNDDAVSVQSDTLLDAIED